MIIVTGSTGGMGRIRPTSPIRPASGDRRRDLEAEKKYGKLLFRIFPAPDPAPRQMLRFLMEQRELRQRDLLHILARAAFQRKPSCRRPGFLAAFICARICNCDFFRPRRV